MQDSGMTCSMCRCLSGIDGHSAIFFHEAASARESIPIFQCAECNARYFRRSEGDGVSVWEQVGTPDESHRA